MNITIADFGADCTSMTPEKGGLRVCYNDGTDEFYPAAVLPLIVEGRERLTDTAVRCIVCTRPFTPSRTTAKGPTCSTCVVSAFDTRMPDVDLREMPKIETALQTRINKEVRAFAREHGYTTKMKNGQRIVVMIGKGFATKTSLYTWTAVTPRTKQGRPGKPKKHEGLRIEVTAGAVRLTGQEAPMARFLAQRTLGLAPRLAGTVDRARTGGGYPHPDQAGVDGNRRPSVDPSNAAGDPGEALWVPESLAEGVVS